MADKIDLKTMQDLFGDTMPVDMVIMLHDLNPDLSDDDRIGVLRRILKQRAIAWNQEQLNRKMADDRTKQLEAEISRLNWIVNP